MQIDKRSHERVKVEGVVYYSDVFQEDEPQKNPEKHEGRLVDICPDGICMSTRHKFLRESKLQLDIMDHCKGTYIGIVKWCVKNSDDKYNVGLEVPFNNMI